jgi:hypothetical protein
MIDAYLDESGIHDGAAVCVIAGYFGGRGQWRKLEQAWKQALNEFDVPMEKFHAKELYPKPTGFFRHHWDTSRHEPFLQRLAAAVADCGKINPVGFGVIVEDFFSYSENVRKFFTGANMKDGQPTTLGCPNKPYFLPFQRCLVRVCEYAPIGGKAHFFFGLDRPFAGYANELFAQIKSTTVQPEIKRRLGDPSFPLAKETPQLQAADLLTHLTYHYMLDTHRQNVIGQIQPFPLLATCIRNRRANEDFGFFDKTMMRENLILAAEVSRQLKESIKEPKP